MIVINPYLNFKGNTEEAFNFYKSVFGGEFIMLIRFKDTPEAAKTPAEDLEKLMHISLKIGKDTILMGTDAIGPMGDHLVQGNNFHLAIGTQSTAEADDHFAKLAEGGKVTVPLTKQFWGAYFGMLTDKFGIQWMISYDENFKPE
jgi:PhnB protein